MYRYFKDLVKLPSRTEDKPGDDMVMDPQSLSDLSKDDEEKIRHKIFHEGHKLDPETAVYENIFAVLFHHFPVTDY